jgi:hypothetical protein
MTNWALLLTALLFAAWLWLGESTAIDHPPGVLVAHEPFQDAVGRLPRLAKPGYQIEPLARFSIEARVLRAEHYRLDRGAELAPVDLALGWGAMSDTAVLEKLKITQGMRFYHWQSVDGDLPIPRGYIETHSANMHMVPADESVARVLKEARRGSIVQLSGYLIEIRGADGYIWRSSLTRDDTGNGACELIWVERIELR